MKILKKWFYLKVNSHFLLSKIGKLRCPLFVLHTGRRMIQKSALIRQSLYTSCHWRQNLRLGTDPPATAALYQLSVGLPILPTPLFCVIIRSHASSDNQKPHTTCNSRLARIKPTFYDTTREAAATDH